MDSLKDVLLGVDWAANIASALGNGDDLQAIDAAVLKIAVWAKQIEISEAANVALPFIREMQSAAHSSGALIGLCLYKSSAAASRTLVENALYYTYFRSHPQELRTLVYDPKYYISKTEIIEFHKLHTVGFKSNQAAIGLVSRIEDWYSEISAVVHGQVPGAWTPVKSLAQTAFNEPTQQRALNALLDAAKIVHGLFICTVTQESWGGFAPDSKTFLLKGMSGTQKASLGLDSK